LVHFETNRERFAWIAATSIQEGCDLFVTTDEKHLLRTVCREAFEKHIKIINPIQSLEL